MPTEDIVKNTKKPIYRRKRVVLPLSVLLFLVLCDLAIVCTTHGGSHKVEVATLDIDAVSAGQDLITLLTINMAHGRRDGRNQILQSGKAIRGNIDAIGELIAREGAQLVALQEADAPSWWSGGFSHVNRVAALGSMTSAIQGTNVSGWGLHYGAAIVSQLEVSDAHQITFPRNIPTFSKGFVVATCEWPGDQSFRFDVVSLHLDFASAKVRSKQLSVLENLVTKTDRPIIIMGDFNTDMSKSLLPQFISRTGLQTWKADDQSIVTFPALKSRIDWILASSEFRIVEQSVLDDVLSDHRILKAVIGRR
ncbi:MAG: hypothetical protein HN380_00010 [Victivallales bacterium]|jgi:endonuclease/exonuclease/phosphatase family metal-dependent hydrolase|nr:hypothetical protein [Victivallales bacterium]